MLEGKKILVTGPAGQIAFPLASTLAQSNEVWGIARFTDPASRERVESAGVRAHAGDLAAGEFAGLPDDFDYVLHLATYRSGGLDYDQALRVNAEGTQLLLAHCRSSSGVLVMSTSEVYKPQADPHHHYRESDPLGDSNSLIDPTYSVSKISQEAVARACARAYDIPVVIARMNASYGDNGGLLAYHLDWILSGKPVMVKWDPAMYSPIHEDDIFGQTEALLARSQRARHCGQLGGRRAGFRAGVVRVHGRAHRAGAPGDRARGARRDTGRGERRLPTHLDHRAVPGTVANGGRAAR